MNCLCQPVKATGSVKESLFVNIEALIQDTEEHINPLRLTGLRINLLSQRNLPAPPSCVLPPLALERKVLNPGKGGPAGNSI